MKFLIEILEPANNCSHILTFPPIGMKSRTETELPRFVPFTTDIIIQLPNLHRPIIENQLPARADSLKEKLDPTAKHNCTDTLDPNLTPDLTEIPEPTVANPNTDRPCYF